MKKSSSSMILAAVTAAAVSLAPAANAATAPRVEKHIVVSSTAEAGAEEAREAVTFLGVEVNNVPPVISSQLKLPEGQGLVVTFVAPDSPAAAAGLLRHDILLKMDDQILIDQRQLSVLVRGHKEGDKVVVSGIRAGAEFKSTVTLGKHDAPRSHMGWIGSMPEMPTFEERIFELPGIEAERAIRMRGHAIRHPGLPGGGSGSRVMIFHPRTNVVFVDDDGALELTVNDEVKILTAKDAKGAVVFTGPVSTEEQRKALPEGLRARLEKLEAMDVLEAPEPPEPPEPPEMPRVLPAPAPVPAPAPRGGITDQPQPEVEETLAFEVV